MKRWLTIVLLVSLFFSCKREKGLEWFSEQKADEYFREVKAVCDRDSGRMWGENLYGPLMFVDSRSRIIYTNSPDTAGLLKPKGNIYIGELPPERIITNNVTEFGGVRYAMMPIPDTEDHYRMMTRAVHSLFHCFQERKGLKPASFNTRHMNEKNARLYLKLEWKALTGALVSEGEARNQAIRDALIFRGARRELFPEAVGDENRFENYEGLTTYTYIKLCTSGKDELQNRILEYLDRIYKNTSYASGYGFVHGALYAALLDAKGFDFKTVNDPGVDLGAATSALYSIELPGLCRDVAGSIALNYDLPSIREEESEREALINEHIHKIVNTFIDKPVVIITMESPNFSFEPEDISSLDTLGTHYERLRVSDNWGRLNVEGGGALLTNDLRTLRITAKEIKSERNHLSGEGWHLMLNDEWELSPDESGNYFIRRRNP